MKNKKPYSERREKEIKRNCLVSGIVFIAIGVFLITMMAASVIKTDADSFWAVLPICILSIVMGIYQLNMPKIAKKKDAEKNNTDSAEFGRILKRRENAQRKIRQNSYKDAHNLKWELYSHQIVYTLLMALFLFIIGIIFWMAYKSLFLLFIMAIVCIPLLIYYIFNLGYSGLKKYAAKNGIDFKAVEDDFSSSKIFRTVNSFLSVSYLYTIVINEKEKVIFDNKDILLVTSFYGQTDHYSNGIYTGTVTMPYIMIGTKNGNVINVRCAEFAEEIIIEAFQNNAAYMCEDFKVMYPEKPPAYFGK